MGSGQRTPTLMFRLCGTGVLTLVEKGLFGSVRMSGGKLLNAALYIFQTGAVLGRSKRDRLEALAKLVRVGRGLEPIFGDTVRDLAQARLNEYGGEPETLVDFVWKTAYARAGVNWPEDYRAAEKLDKQKMPLEELEPGFHQVFIEGIGFGAYHPELMERIWKRTYVDVDSEKVDYARRMGVNLPEQIRPLPLDEAEQEIFIEVAKYASEFFPDVVDALDLRSYLPET